MYVDHTPQQPGAVPTWFPRHEPPSARQRRKHGLADELRALITDVLMLDAEQAEEGVLAEAERLLAAARTLVAALPDVREKGGVYGNPGDAPLWERSPFSGRCNALATPLRLWADGERTVGEATYGEAYEGPPGSVHGGHVIAAFDDLLGIAQAVTGQPGFTGTLSVRLVGRTPLNQRIDYEAGVESVSGRKVMMWGRSSCGGALLAEAAGIFIAPRGGLDLPNPPG